MDDDGVIVSDERMTPTARATIGKMMSSFLPRLQKQGSMVYFLILALLFSGTGTLTGLPLFLAAVAHSHPIYISEDNHKIHLILHHPGNRDEHEVSDGLPTEHRHDLFDSVLSVSKKGAFPHTDHEVELPAYDEKVSTTTKNNIVHKNPAVLAIFHSLSISTKPLWVYSTPSYVPAMKSPSGFLRTAILRI